MKKFYVIVKQNKNGQGNHVELRINLGYTDKIVSFDRTTIAEILGVTIETIVTAKVGQIWEIN